MTYAHLVGYYPPHVGGMENMARALAEACARTGEPVEVITSDQGADGAPRVDRRDNLVVRRLPSVEFAHTPFTWGVLSSLWRLPRGSILHVHVAQIGFPEAAVLVAKLHGLKTVAHFHLDVPPSGPLGPLFSLYKRLLFGRVMRRMDRVIALSNDQRTLLVDKYGLDSDRIEVMHNTPDPRFRATDPYEPSSSGLRLLFVGRLEAQKKAHRLLEAFARTASNAHLEIVGDGELRGELERLADSLGLGSRVTFTGALTGDALREAYARNDALVMCSDVEGWPLVLLEAMGMGLPVIGTDVIGIHEMIEGTGMLVAEPYVDNLAAVFDELSRQPERLRELSNASLVRSQDFSPDKVLGQLLAIYLRAAR